MAKSSKPALAFPRNFDHAQTSPRRDASLVLQRFARLTVVILIMTAASIGAQPSILAQPREPSLAGQLLIAPPGMPDPRFASAVILVVKHDQHGAMGIIINRPVEDRAISSLLEPSPGEHQPALSGTVRIHSGGPVQPELGFVLHSAEYHRSETLDITRGIAMTATADILRDIASNRGPNKILVAFGYAGWRAGQLEDELARRMWFTASADSKLVFDEDRDKVWELAFSRRTEDL